MEYKNKVIYPIDWYPNREEILKIQPIDLYKWFAYRSYGTETPGPEDKPIHRPEVLKTSQSIYELTPSGLLELYEQAFTCG